MHVSVRHIYQLLVKNRQPQDARETPLRLRWRFLFSFLMVVATVVVVVYTWIFDVHMKVPSWRAGRRQPLVRAEGGVGVGS